MFMQTSSLLKLVLVTLGFTAAAQPSMGAAPVSVTAPPPSTGAAPAPVRLQVTWASPLPVPPGATIRLEVTSPGISVTTITNLWMAVGPTERSLDVPLPDRAVFESTLGRSGNCEMVAPTRARLGWLSLGVWFGNARLGELELYEGKTPLLVGYADTDSQQPDWVDCKTLVGPVLAAGWNVLRRPEGEKGTARPLRGPLTARYVSALPAPAATKARSRVRAGA